MWPATLHGRRAGRLDGSVRKPKRGLPKAACVPGADGARVGQARELAATRRRAGGRSSFPAASAAMIRTISKQENTRALRRNSSSDGSLEVCRAITLGDSGVGKTCLLERFCTGKFIPGMTTIGVSFKVRATPANQRRRDSVSVLSTAHGRGPSTVAGA